jgi:hypothetical protein
MKSGKSVAKHLNRALGEELRKLFKDQRTLAGKCTVSMSDQLPALLPSVSCPTNKKIVGFLAAILVPATSYKYIQS